MIKLRHGCSFTGSSPVTMMFQALNVKLQICDFAIASPQDVWLMIYATLIALFINIILHFCFTQRR